MSTEPGWHKTCSCVRVYIECVAFHNNQKNLPNMSKKRIKNHVAIMPCPLAVARPALRRQVLCSAPAATGTGAPRSSSIDETWPEDWETKMDEWRETRVKLNESLVFFGLLWSSLVFFGDWFALCKLFDCFANERFRNFQVGKRNQYQAHTSSIVTGTSGN